MMITQVPFINREEELTQIEELIGQWGTRRILCIQASGGIGKTRLLQEVRRKQTAKSDSAEHGIIVTEIIDFDDDSFHNPKNLLHKIAEISDEKKFEPYFRVLSELRNMEKADSISERVLRTFLEKHEQAFTDCFRTIRSRVVLFMDTCEAVQGTELWDYLAKIISQIENIFILITGRNAKQVGTFLQEKTQENIRFIALKPLNKEASAKYLTHKQRISQVSLEPELIRNLIILAQGRPILLDLAVEWRLREIPLDWLLENTPEEGVFSEKQIEEFERQLICHIADTQLFTDWLILLMAIIYPLNARMIAELLDMPEHQANTLFEQAEKFVFVKQLPDKRISLHDEMRRMINKYVWTSVDPDGERQRDYLERQIRSLGRRIERVQEEEKTYRYQKDISEELNASMIRESLEQERWELKKRLLDHILPADIDETVKVITDLFDESTRIYRLFFRKSLIERMEQCIRRLSAKHTAERYELKKRLIKYFQDCGEYQKASDLVTEILQEEAILPEQQIDMTIQNANLHIRLGNLEQGIADFKSAASVSKKQDFQKYLIRSLNGLGWAYRNQGHFDRALENYLEAYHLSLDIGEYKQIALLLNNISYIYARKGKFQSALENCRRALELCKDREFRRIMGFAYSTQGEIYIRFEHPKEATESYEKALDIFQKEADSEWVSTVQCGLAAVHLSQEEFDKAEEHLNQAIQNAPENLKHRILYYMSRIHIGRHQLNDARQKLEESRILSRKIGDYFYDYVTFLKLIELAYEFREYGQWKQFNDEHNRLYGSRKSEMDLRLRGSCMLSIANLALCSGEYEEALAVYKKSLMMMVKYEVLWRYSVGEQIRRADKQIRECVRKDLLVKLAKDMILCWKENQALMLNSPESLLIFQEWVA